MNEQMGHPGKIRVLVADDSRIHTELLTEALKRDRGLAVFAGDSDIKKLAAEVRLHSTDVLVISGSLDGSSNRGFDVVRELRAANSQIRAIMLLESSDREAVLDAFRAGAAGILSRHEPLETLTRCVRSVFEGQVWANSHHIKYALEALACIPAVRAIDSNGLNLLSKREVDVVQCLAEGLTNREIAERLGLSQHTVKNYLFRVFDKLGVSNRVELLFMTLSRENTLHTARNAPRGFDSNRNEAVHIEDNLHAAENGAPAAQLALAELHFARAANPADLVRADMWYSIVIDQLEETRRTIHAQMTPEQVLEAEHRAAEWLARAMKILPSSAYVSGRHGRATSAASSAD